MQFTRRDIIQMGGLASSILLAPRQSRASDPITLQVSHAFPGSHAEMIAEVGRKFTAAHPGIKISYIAGGNNWQPLLQRTLRDAITGGLPDLSHQSLAYTRILVDRGAVRPLEPLFGGLDHVGALNIPPSLLGGARVGNSIYGLPFGTTLPVIYYNMDLLRRAGYGLDELPATWPKVIDAAVKIAAFGGRIIGGYVEYEATNAWIFQNLLAAFGGHMMKSDESDVTFDSPQGQEALEILWQFGAAGGANMSVEQARQAFDAGTIGVHIRSASGITAVEQAAAGRFDLRIGQFPVPSSEGHLVGAAHGLVIFTKDAERQRAAWEYMKFAMAPEGQAILAEKSGYMPINMIAVQDPTFLADYYRRNPHHRALVEHLPTVTDWYSFHTDYTTKIFDMLNEEMRRVLTHEKRPETALADMARETRKLLKI